MLQLRFLVALFLLQPLLAAESRSTIFISDTHFGVGRLEGGWHQYEDARWAVEFGLFLDYLATTYPEGVDLVLNGDTFELWQSIGHDCSDTENRDWGCSESEALDRLRRVLSAHAPEMKAIGAFAAKGANRVFIVPGNHDAALMFESVARLAVEATGAPTGRVQVETKGFWVSGDGRILAEHGHQIGNDVNRFQNWPKPFLSSGSTRRLEKPWGEQFVQQFFDELEYKYPIIDNFADETLGVKYGIAVEGLRGLARNASRFFRFALLGVSSNQFYTSLGQSKTPVWNVKAVRESGGQFLVESMPVEESARESIREAWEAEVLDKVLAKLSDDEIRAICDRRYLESTNQARLDRKVLTEPCPGGTLGALKAALTSTRDAVFRSHLEQIRESTGNGFTLFVWSHTHLADAGFDPFEGTFEDWHPWVVNSGAWQRTVNERQLSDLRKRRQLDAKGVLSLAPEDLPACYPFVLAKTHNPNVQSRLRYWRLKDGRWGVSLKCD